MAFFEERSIFRWRTKEKKIVEKFINNNEEINNLSHLVRIALMQYIKHYGKEKDETITSRDSAKSFKGDIRTGEEECEQTEQQ